MPDQSLIILLTYPTNWLFTDSSNSISDHSELLKFACPLRTFSNLIFSKKKRNFDKKIKNFFLFIFKFKNRKWKRLAPIVKKKISIHIFSKQGITRNRGRTEAEEGTGPLKRYSRFRWDGSIDPADMQPRFDNGFSSYREMPPLNRRTNFCAGNRARGP